jgi:hypothetical protein
MTEMLLHPNQQELETRGRVSLRHRSVDVLSLTAVAVRRHDHSTRDPVGDGGPVFAAHQL